LTEVSAGRVGRAHGRDGSFYVEGADHPLAVGTTASPAPSGASRGAPGPTRGR